MPGWKVAEAGNVPHCGFPARAASGSSLAAVIVLVCAGPDCVTCHRDGGQLEHELKCTMPLAEITGLRSGSLYRFRVQAFNEVLLQSTERSFTQQQSCTAMSPLSLKVCEYFILAVQLCCMM